MGTYPQSSEGVHRPSAVHSLTSQLLPLPINYKGNKVFKMKKVRPNRMLAPGCFYFQNYYQHLIALNIS